MDAWRYGHQDTVKGEEGGGEKKGKLGYFRPDFYMASVDVSNNKKK